MQFHDDEVPFYNDDEVQLNNDDEIPFYNYDEVQLNNDDEILLDDDEVYDEVQLNNNDQILLDDDEVQLNDVDNIDEYVNSGNFGKLISIINVKSYFEIYNLILLLIILDNILKGLRLFQIKNNYNISEAAFNEILKILKIPEITLYKLKKFLGKLVPLTPILVDCCINSCVAFTGEFTSENICPECKEPRYRPNETLQISRKQAVYWSIIDSLKMQYKDKNRSETLCYRHNYTSTHEYFSGEQMKDVFDGARYKDLTASGLFSDYRDIALIASTDGFQVFHQNRNDCWVILFINANLPPDIRVQQENLMISALIPGPKAPKNFNSFLRPLVDELKQLQGM